MRNSLLLVLLALLATAASLHDDGDALFEQSLSGFLGEQSNFFSENEETLESATPAPSQSATPPAPSQSATPPAPSQSATLAPSQSATPPAPSQSASSTQAVPVSSESNRVGFAEGWQGFGRVFGIVIGCVLIACCIGLGIYAFWLARKDGRPSSASHPLLGEGQVKAKSPRGFIVGAVVCLIAGVLSLSLALAIPFSGGASPTAVSNRASTGRVVAMIGESFDNRFLPTVSWRIQTWDGKLLQFASRLFNAFTPRSESGVALKPGQEVEGSLVVDENGVTTFADVRLSHTQREALVSGQGALRLNIFFVSFKDPNSCGSQKTSEVCEDFDCSQSKILESFFGSGDSVAGFVSSISNGKVTLSKGIIKSVQIGYVDHQDKLVEAVASALGSSPLVGGATHASFVVPRNWRLGNLAPPAAGIATLGGSYSWLRSCTFGVLNHEFFHNLGLDHSGSYVGSGYKGGYRIDGSKMVVDKDGKFGEYVDWSSIMGYPTKYNGLAASQMAQLGLLKSTQIKKLSLSDSGTFAFSALTDYASGDVSALLFDNTYWLEWRKKKGFDKDLNGQTWQARDKAWVYDSLLLRRVVAGPYGMQQTVLEGIVPVGETVKIGSHTIKHVKKGTIRLNGGTADLGDAAPQQETQQPSSSSNSGAASCVRSKGAVKIRSKASSSSSVRFTTRANEKFSVVWRSRSWIQVRSAQGVGFSNSPRNFVETPC